ncbi:acyltransferase 3 [Neocallimastix lanati (nom. inval.)]|nr:acyltransferase 3 [Neocallimastix sp. JGI-2020a]
MISGILFLDVEKPITIKTLYTKYIFRIFRCLIFWSIYYIFIDKFLINFNQENYNFDYETIKDTVVKSIYRNGHLWYLNFIMGIYMVTPIFRGIAYNNKEIKYIFWLFFTVSSIIPTTYNFFETFFSIKLTIIIDFFNSLRINSARGFAFYYLWGYLLAYNDNDGKKFKIFSYLIGALGIVLTVFLRIFSSIYLGKENNFFGEYNCVNVAMTAYGIFIFFKYTINDYIENFSDDSTIKKCVLSLSNCTLGIYLIHMTIHHLLYRFAKFDPQSFNPLFCAPLFSVVVYILSFMIIFVFRKTVPYFEYIC